MGKIDYIYVYTVLDLNAQRLSLDENDKGFGELVGADLMAHRRDFGRLLGL